MQKIILFILFFSLLSCRYKKVSKLWDFPQKQTVGSSYFSYGTEPNNKVEANPDSPPTWGPSLQILEDKICIHSQDDFFRSREYGPTVGLCLDKTSENETLLRLAIETLHSLDETKLRPDGNLAHDGSKIPLHFLSVTEIVNEISKSKSRLFFIGDNRLYNALEKRMDMSFENHNSIPGNLENHVETSFTLPYFSIYKADNTYKLVFPPIDSWTPRSQFHYLTIELNNHPEFLSKFQTTFSDIQSINETWKKDCSNAKLEITEVMGYASSSTKRFIEWTGSKTNATCLDSITLSLLGTSKKLNFHSQFLFPSAVKLFIEPDSILQGFPISDFNWRDIKSNSTLSIQNSEIADTWKLPENTRFHWTLEEFSLKRVESPCEWTSLIILSSQFCGDPGIEFQDPIWVSNPEIPAEPNPIPTNTKPCKLEDFSLTELNAHGLRIESTVDRTGKFIELSYLGIEACKLSDLALVVNNTTPIPLFTKDTILFPNSILLVTEGKHFIDVKNLIRRNLDFLVWQDTIEIKSNSNSKILWVGFGKEDFFLPESMNGNIYSLVFSNGKISHHSISSPNLLQSIYRLSHQMSPGEKNKELENTATGEISEVLWAGGYKNSTAIADEKFVEIKTQGLGSLELEIITPTKKSRYYFPVLNTNEFTILAKNSFSCFPTINPIISKDLNLSNEKTSITLKSFGNTLDIFSYTPSLEQGINNISQKIRASVVKTGFNQILKTSSQNKSDSIHAECKEQTLASPNKTNDFEPFLVDESFNYFGNGKFYLATTTLDFPLPFSVNLYSYSPKDQIQIQLEKINYTNLLKPITQTLQTSGLIYQRLEGFSDLKLYNKDGVFIEGILPSPSNSQNEWILICNRSAITKDLSDYEIEDENSFDLISAYTQIKKVPLPSGVSNEGFLGNSTLLSEGQCGYLIDPDASNIKLEQIGISPTLLFTVRTTGTIGNGISSGEKLDLFKTQDGKRIHVHSFGNKYSHSPFSIPVLSDEIIFLSPQKRGETRFDYEVVKW